MNLQTRIVRFQQIAAIALALAGLLHLVIAPTHWEHAPAHGLFFVISGLAEIAWAIAFIRRPGLKLSIAGLVMAVGLVVLWAISRIWPAPFGHGPEEIDPYGLICKLTEAVGVLTLALILFQSYLTSSSNSVAWRTLLGVMLVSLLLGWLSYGVARASEPFLPTLAATPNLDYHEVWALDSICRPLRALVAAPDEFHREGVTAETWAKVEPVPSSTLEERTGLQVKLIAVTAMGGLVDFRYKVLDSEKAVATMQNHEEMPQLVAEDSGTVLTASEGMHHKLSFNSGRVYYVFYPNQKNVIKPGTPVSVVIGDMRLEHLIAQ